MIVKIIGRSYSKTDFAILAAALIVMSATIVFYGHLEFKPRYKAPLAQWRPAFCATFLSADNIPLAVCSDTIYPVYEKALDGYRGKLKDCVIEHGARIRDCRFGGENR